MESKNPWMRLLSDRWVVGVATLGPVGKMKKAPGTWGSAVGLLWYALVFHDQPWLLYLITLGILVLLAVEFAHEAEVRLQKRDPGEIVLDEFVAVPLCFFMMQDVIESGHGWPVLLAGFLLFRLFDIWKPYPISKLQDIPGGVGVVADDLAAAAYTCIALQVAARYFGWF